MTGHGLPRYRAPQLGPGRVVLFTLSLMIGTAGLPHVIIRFFTVPNIQDARWSASWALVFIALFYTVAPAVGSMARFNLTATMWPGAAQGATFSQPAVSLADIETSEDLAWMRNWQTTGLLNWEDKNGDGLIQYYNDGAAAQATALAAARTSGDQAAIDAAQAAYDARLAETHAALPRAPPAGREQELGREQRLTTVFQRHHRSGQPGNRQPAGLGHRHRRRRRPEPPPCRPRRWPACRRGRRGAYQHRPDQGHSAPGTSARRASCWPRASRWRCRTRSRDRWAPEPCRALRPRPWRWPSALPPARSSRR